MKITIDEGVDVDCTTAITLADQYVGLNIRNLFSSIRHCVPMVVHGYGYVGQVRRVVLVALWPLATMLKVMVGEGA